MRRLLLILPLTLTFGCASTEPFEQQIRELTWRLDAAEQAAEQAVVDKRLAERELGIANQQLQIKDERLELSYDALRETRKTFESELQTRLNEMASTEPGSSGPLVISQYGGIVLESEIFFAAGQHALTPAGKKALKGLADLLMKPEYADKVVEVVGHTDTDPIRKAKDRYRDNYDLGGMRANSVRIHLESLGIPAGHTYLSSWGPTRPLQTGNKARNRRVEIVLHDPSEATPVEASPTLPASAKKD
ncbi:MAG: OmpA family protein [Planctomycetes bacterium]|nr:OmpA family protein [Planctomycetota bacterium]